MTRIPNWCTAVAVLLIAVPTFASTFVVPDDRNLPKRADAIVVGTALTSYAQWSADSSVETLTIFSVTEIIKGNVSPTINIVEPGGSIDGISVVMAGVPRFASGEKALLFLRKTGTDRWAVADLAVGKFASVIGGNGRLLQRDADDIVGWDSHLNPFVDRPRDEARFLAFVREVTAGRRDAAADYFVAPALLRPRAQSLTPQPQIAPYSATSYTMNISGALGARWAVFPDPVTFFSGTQTEPGAPGGGVTAIQAAFASWDNDCGSNVNYVYGGGDNGTHSNGLHGVDGLNTILFERDLSAWGVAPFTCSGNSYSGTLGIGGVTSASGTNSVSGETFSTTQEADVEMNRGIANCTLLFNNGDFNSAVTHEVGHTLGFRHSDQTRNSGAACTTDASLECSNTAIMKSFITTGLNAALQAWDQHAVQAVYPGNVCAPGPICTAPTITSQPASVVVPAGTAVTLSVGATGTSLTYQWYVGTSGVTTNPIGGANGPTLTVTPPSTTTYWVKVSNSCGSANSASATVTVRPIVASSFFLVVPCRILDTRGGTPLAANGSMNVIVTGKCGIPVGATSLAVNVTAVEPGASGFVTLYPGPANTVFPGVSTLNYTANRTRANNARILIGSDGSINIFNAASLPLNLLLDLSGYFK